MKAPNEAIEKRAFIALCRDSSLSVAVRKEVARILCEHGLHTEAGRRILSFISPSGLKNADVELIKAQERGVKVHSLIDADYPYRLSQIDDAPLAIFVRGSLADGFVRPDSESSFLPIAIVGSRKSSQKARCFAEELAFELTKMGAVIISGLAYGIDTSAHRGAIMATEQFINQDSSASLLSAGVAVLGSGVLNVYPDENKKLAEALIENNGALVSEHGLDAGPRKHHFPARNRIISGLCRAVVVVEAGEKSGACITARTALEQGREVCAVPGAPWNDLSVGTNRLIKQGAMLIESADDVLNLFPEYVTAKCTDKKATLPEQYPIQADNAECLENQIVRTLQGARDMHIDDLAILLSVLPHELMHVLTCLEIRGSIYRHPGERYAVHRFVDK